MAEPLSAQLAAQVLHRLEIRVALADVCSQTAQLRNRIESIQVESSEFS